MLQNITTLEKDLWEAADQLRANSKLNASEYAMPVLGLILLRHAARERIKRIAIELLEAVKAEIATLDNWTAKTTTQAAVQTLIHNYL